MGAYYGHMNHLYDNGALKFGQLKQILKSASQGELLGTEKLDGMNLYVSYSVRESKAKAVRNKSTLKAGGLDAEQLAAKFSGRGGVEEAFNTAFQNFERAVRGLSPSEQIAIFGRDADIFYNSEVIDYRTINVVNYSTTELVIHRVGHVRVNPKTREVLDVDISGNFEKLEASMEKMNKKIAKDKYSIQTGAIRRLEKFLSEEPLKRAISDIEEVQKKYNLNDENHVNDLIAANLVPHVRDLPLSNDMKREVVLRLLQLKGALGAPQITKGLSKDVKQKVSALIKNKQLYKQAVLPLEEIIHDFAVEALRAFESAFILDPTQNAKTIRDNISSIRQDVMNSNDENQIKVLTKQLEKLKDVESAHIGSSEGFVFVGPDNVTYKLTGNFAPINQILGMRFRQSERKDLREEEQTKTEYMDIKRVVGIYPGKFKPPHRGHLFSIKEALKKCSHVLVLVGPVERKLKDGTEITAEKSVQLLETFMEAEGIDTDQVTVAISESNSPVQVVFDVLNGEEEGLLKMGFPSEGDMIVPIRSDKLDPKSGRLDPATNQKDPETQKPDWWLFRDFHHEELKFPNVWAGDASEFAIPAFRGLGATEFREALEQERDITKFIPKGIDPEYVYSVLGLKKKDSEEITDSESSLDNQNELEESFQSSVAKPRAKAAWKTLLDGGRKDLIKFSAPFNQPRSKHSNALVAKEASGAGAIAGHVGAPPPKKDCKKKKKGKKKTNYFGEVTLNSRKEIMEELKLRKTIKRFLNIERKRFIKRTIAEAVEAFRLRAVVKTLISESDVEKSPHSNTGINKLEALLKNIIPSIEDGYKTLTSKKEQRDSFRRHILNAIKNALTPQALAARTDGEKEKVSEDVEINIKDDDKLNASEEEKFIDINPEEEEEEEVDPKEEFTISGEDMSGRDEAFATFKQIENQVIDAYSVLHDPEDRDIFYDYLLTNLKLYFDKFEDELGGVSSEPESKSYDPDATPAGDTEIPGADASPEGGGDELDLGGEEGGDLDLGGDDEEELDLGA